MRELKKLEDSYCGIEVIEDLGIIVTKSGRRVRKAVFMCPDCKVGFTRTVQDVKDGKNKSCGCTRYSRVPHNKTHGDSRTKLHFMWMNMIARVDKSEHYKDIELCDEWRE